LSTDILKINREMILDTAWQGTLSIRYRQLFSGISLLHLGVSD